MGLSRWYMVHVFLGLGLPVTLDNGYRLYMYTFDARIHPRGRTWFPAAIQRMIYVYVGLIDPPQDG